MADTVIEVFQEAQTSIKSHKSGCKKLTIAIKKDVELLNFLHRHCIDKILICSIQTSKKDSLAEKLMSFTAAWLSEASEEVFINTVLHLCNRSQSLDKVVRIRSCQLIAHIFQNVSSSSEMDVTFLETAAKVLSERLRDKITTVRLWAVKAVAKLQNHHNDNDITVYELLRIMQSDSSADVRVAALETISVFKVSLPEIINRMKDVKTEVRLAAVQKLTNDVRDVRYWKPKQRRFAIECGLHDRDESVLKASKRMFLTWLEVLDNDVPKVLGLIGLHAVEAEEYAYLILDSVHGMQEGISPALRQAVRDLVLDWSVDFKTCSAAVLFWTLMRCKYAHEKLTPAAADQISESLLSDTLQLCRLLQEAFAMDLEDDEDAMQKTDFLLRLAAFTDTSDEAGRTELGSVCQKMLSASTNPVQLVEPLLNTWVRCCCSDEAVVIGDVVSLAERLWEDADKELAEETIDEDLEFTMRLRASELSMWCLQRALSGSQAVRARVAPLGRLMDLALQQPVAEVRAMAMRCIGISGMLSIASQESEAAKRCRDVMLQTVSLEDEESDTRSQALQTLADMFLVDPEATKSKADFDNLLLRLMDGDDDLMMCTAAEAAAKLLFNGVLTDPRLFAKLLLMFFRPVLVDSDEGNEGGGGHLDAALGTPTRLQQVLNIFLKAFFRVGGGREQVALAATVELVAVMTVQIRDGEAEVELVVQIVEHLLFLCSLLTSFSPPGGVLNGLDAPLAGDEPASHRAARAIRLRLAAALLRELLKLGSNSVDKTLSRELSKLFGFLIDDFEWVTATVAPQVHAATRCVLNRCVLDKAGQKVLEKLANHCETLLTPSAETVEQPNSPEQDETAAPFHSLAPGLADLVQLAASGGASRRTSGGSTTSSEATAVKRSKTVSKAKKGSSATESPPEEDTVLAADAKSPATSSPRTKKGRGGQTPLSSRHQTLKRGNESVASGRQTDSPSGTSRSPRSKRDKVAVCSSSDEEEGEDENEGVRDDKRHVITASGYRASSRISKMTAAPTYKDLSSEEDEGDEEEE